jgi:hypothetical protein
MNISPLVWEETDSQLSWTTVSFDKTFFVDQGSSREMDASKLSAILRGHSCAFVCPHDYQLYGSEGGRDFYDKFKADHCVDDSEQLSIAASPLSMSPFPLSPMPIQKIVCKVGQAKQSQLT